LESRDIPPRIHLINGSNRNRGTSASSASPASLQIHACATLPQSCVYKPRERVKTSTMISSGFTNAPVSQFLVYSTVIGAIVATITDTRYYLHLSVVPHIWEYRQFWRFLTWQVCKLDFWKPLVDMKPLVAEGKAVSANQHKSPRHASQTRPRYSSPS
jgi:hypothetical protein